MAEHEACVGASDEWFTPPEIFDALGLTFDLDPCQPEQGRAFLSVPCRRFYTEADDGLAQPWQGLVWMNPPFGGRNGQVPWLKRFFDHGNGIALVAARTSAGWFHDEATRAETMLLPRGKTKFIRGGDMISVKKGVDGRVIQVIHPAGSRGESPGSGIVLLGMGEVANAALMRSGLGLCVWTRQPPSAGGPGGCDG